MTDCQTARQRAGAGVGSSRVCRAQQRSSMKLMILVVGSVGDLLPVLGFARLVQGQGHDSVTIVTTANFKDDVLKAGLDYMELGDAESYERVITEAEQAIAKGGIPKISKEAQALLDAVPPRYYDL